MGLVRTSAPDKVKILFSCWVEEPSVRNEKLLTFVVHSDCWLLHFGEEVGSNADHGHIPIFDGIRLRGIVAADDALFRKPVQERIGDEVRGVQNLEAKQLWCISIYDV